MKYVKSLAIKNPELSQQWHPTKNGELTPNDVTTGSGKKVWWQCKNGHEWKAVISSRNSGVNCPYCSGKRAFSDNCLQYLNPELSSQWHPTKNEDITPNDVTSSSSKKVWWKCEKGHEWKASINNRAKGSGCPACNQGSQTSFPEQAIYYYLKKVFKDTVNRYRFHNKWEIDVFVPSLMFGIEYDGIYYHQAKETSDLRKEKYIANKGIHLLRVKETKDALIKCYNKDNFIFCSSEPSEFQLNEVIAACFEYISKNILHKSHNIDIDVIRDRIEIYNLYIESEQEESFFAKYPELSKQWHLDNNLSIKPDMVRSGSNIKVWWQCEKGHEWEATVKNRANGNGCPYCSGKRVCIDNCLQTINPDLANQWHPTKNGDLTPENVTIGMVKKVWWQCERGHEWEATINNRSKSRGCPYCSGKSVCIDNCLQAINPDLANQWHPTKNGDLTPENVTIGMVKKVWWQCKKGHEWDATINDRTNGRGCPFCAGKRACVDNCLQTINPELSKQWHPTKNGALTPIDVTIGSNKRVWWQCEKGHEWDATINSRSKGKCNCPHCRKLKRKN